MIIGKKAIMMITSKAISQKSFNIAKVSSSLPSCSNNISTRYSTPSATGVFNNKTIFISTSTIATFSPRYGMFNSQKKFDVQKDYYGILGLDKLASSEQIKRQYYNLAKQFHPDVNSESAEKFKRINQAYEVLSDKYLKKKYDQYRTIYQLKQKVKSKSIHRKSQTDRTDSYSQQSFEDYKQVYNEMDETQRQHLKSRFRRMMFRIFLLGFGFTFLVELIFGTPKEQRGNNASGYYQHNNYPQQQQHGINSNSSPNNYDPFNLGGSYQQQQRFRQTGSQQ